MPLCRAVDVGGAVERTGLSQPSKALTIIGKLDRLTQRYFLGCYN